MAAFLTDKAAGNGFISNDAVNSIMTVVTDKAEDKTLTFDGGESSLSRRDGRVVVSIRF